jgi:hypothetical protein
MPGARARVAIDCVPSRAIARFAFDAGCQLEIDDSPGPVPPITVGLDGGYIVVESGDPVGPDALRALPVRVLPRKVNPRCLPGWMMTYQQASMAGIPISGAGMRRHLPQSTPQ